MNVYKDSYLCKEACDLLLQPAAVLSELHPNCTCVCDDFLLSFHTLCLTLQEALSADDYTYSTYLLAPLMEKTVRAMMYFPTADLPEKLAPFVEWLASPGEFISLLPILSPSSSENKVSQLVTFMRLTALLEFSLGQLCWSEKGGCPNTMKDLLCSTTLFELLGHKCLSVLRLLYGPVNSLNLRNLVWHGFFTPLDAARCPNALFLFPFVLVVSIGHLLKNQSANLSRASSFSLRPNKIAALDLCRDLAGSIDFTPVILLRLNTFKHHPLASTSSIHFFEEIDRLFNEVPVKYLDICCITLVCITIVLRCEFVHCMNWPEGVYSSHHRFFLTLDSILQYNLDKITTKQVTLENYVEFTRHVDSRVLALLVDLLCAENGPRIKDHLSHGEFTSHLAIYEYGNGEAFHNQWYPTTCLLYTCLLALLSTGCGLPVHHKLDALSSLELQFHPVPAFFHSLRQLRTSLKTLSEVGEQSEPLDAGDIEPNIPPYFHVKPFLEVPADEQWLFSFRLVNSTPAEDHWTYRGLSLLPRITSVLVKTGQTIDVVLRASERFQSIAELNSRQSATYHRLITASPLLVSFVQRLLQLSEKIFQLWIESTLSQSFIPSLSPKQRQSLITCLTHSSEKLFTWSSKSKWENIYEFLKKLQFPHL